MTDLNSKTELPSPWVQQWSDQHQTPSFINTSSGESTWIAPQPAPPAYEKSEPTGSPPFKAAKSSSHSYTNAQQLPSPSSSRSSSHSRTLNAERPALASTSSSSFGNAISRLTNHTPSQRWHSSQSPPPPASQSGLGGRLGGLLNRASGSGSRELQESREGRPVGGEEYGSYSGNARSNYSPRPEENERGDGARYGASPADTRAQDAYFASNSGGASSPYHTPACQSTQQPPNPSSNSQSTLGGLGDLLQSTRIGSRLQERGERLMAIPSRVDGRATGVGRSDKGQRKWEKMERKEERRERKEDRKDRKAERKAVRRGYL